MSTVTTLHISVLNETAVVDRVLNSLGVFSSMISI